MSTYYDIGFIGELPLSELSGLISYAEEREAEEATRSLYIAHFMLAKLQGADPMGYDEYLSAVLSNETEDKSKKPRDPAEIEEEIGAIEAAYRKREEG